jgi:dolichyl-phosphate beta-glucosyltransferase
MKISVVIPAYNEEKRIESTINKIMKYLQAKFDRYEIIIVDDGSTDSTGKIVQKYQKKYQSEHNNSSLKFNGSIILLRNYSNKGKGYSVKRGILKAKYPLVLFSDSDLATPITELDKLIRYSKDFDIIIASRNLKDSEIRNEQPSFRKVLGKTFPLLSRAIVLKGFRDTQCGFKLLKTAKAKKIESLQKLNGFAFDVEMLFIAKRLGCKIKEVPVIWIDKKGSKVNPVKDSARMFIDLFRIKYNHITGKYNMK